MAPNLARSMARSHFGNDTTLEKEPLSERELTWDEVTAHASAADAWIVIKNRVYDVTDFAKIHPAGDIILTAAGQDATDVFAAFHTGTSAASLLPPLCVGRVRGSRLPRTAGEEYTADVLAMRQTMHRLRLFDSSKLYYLWKILSTTLICVASAVLLLSNPTSTPTVAVAAFVLAVFWQQCGWLAHDFLHHQVFNNRGLNNLGGLLIGNIYQGFSVNWWKNKHNHHHAVPNVTDAPSGGDPDIATMPILFWSEKLIEGEDLDRLPLWMLQNQAVLYWPILCMARLSWLLQSFQYQLLPRSEFVTSALFYATELLCLAVHHVLFLALVAHIPGWAHRALFCLISQALGGLFIGIVFTVGHNAMEVLTEKEMRNTDFVRMQVRTTRDVDPHWFTDWFCGGLNYQVEHHIWPTIPRHNLPKAAEILQAFCEKHGLPYYSATLIEGNREVCRLLAALSQKAR